MIILSFDYRDVFLLLKKINETLWNVLMKDLHVSGNRTNVAEQYSTK